MSERGGHRDKALAEALRAAGGITAVASELGVTYQNVWKWRRCPPEHVLDLERLSGVRRERLRPDIFGRRRLSA